MSNDGQSISIAISVPLLQEPLVPSFNGATVYIASFCTVLFFALFSSCASPPKPVIQPRTIDFALYDPAYENDGVWEVEVEELKKVISAFGWSYCVIDHNGLNADILNSTLNTRFSALIIPGGSADKLSLAINAYGEKSIREFIHNGGNYIGFCAGAYYVSDYILFAPYATGNAGQICIVFDYHHTV